MVGAILISPFEKAGRFAQVLHRDDLQAGHHRRFGRVFRGHQHAGLAFRPRAQGDGQNPFDGPHRAVSASSPTMTKLSSWSDFDLFAGRQHAEGDGQIETRPFLLHVGRREIDGRAAQREI